MVRKDIKGQRFGRLMALTYLGNGKWECQCDCGNTSIVYYSNLRYGRTISCGCFQKESISKTHRTHGASRTRLYRIWVGIKERCLNPANKRYAYYGERGITICQEWKDNFEAFSDWSNQNGYSDTLTIDRIENEKGYSPDNCRWVDAKIQSRNRRSNRYIEFAGQKKTGVEWSEITGIPYMTIRDRIYRYGWSIEKALTTPLRKLKRKEA